MFTSGPPSYTDESIHRHVLVSEELDSSLQLVPVRFSRSRTEECIDILKTFCRNNAIDYFLVVNNDVVEVTATGSLSARAIAPYGLLYVPPNQSPGALRDEPRAEFSDVPHKLDSRYNVRIVVTECRLYPSLVESIVRSFPNIAYWDAVNSNVLNPRVMAAWHTLTHLNTLKLSMLNCVDANVCRVQLMHWPTNHLQRLLVLGTLGEDRELCEHIRTFFQYLTHFSYMALFPHETPTGRLLTHFTDPQYQVLRKPWMSDANSDDGGGSGTSVTSTSLRELFNACKLQVIEDTPIQADIYV
jgi:hypothetical protein